VLEMNQKYLHYAFLFVTEELKQIEQSIESDINITVKQHLVKRKKELENDLIDIERLKE
jgi:hypothetical protein